MEFDQVHSHIDEIDSQFERLIERFDTSNAHYFHMRQMFDQMSLWHSGGDKASGSGEGHGHSGGNEGQGDPSDAS